MLCVRACVLTREHARALSRMRIKRLGSGAFTCKVAEPLHQSIMEPGGLIKFHPHPGACQSNGGGTAAKRTSGEPYQSRGMGQRVGSADPEMQRGYAPGPYSVFP